MSSSDLPVESQDLLVPPLDELAQGNVAIPKIPAYRSKSISIAGIQSINIGNR